MSATLQKGGAPTTTYTFSSQPRAVVPQRSKYRNPEEPEKSAYGNLMHDPRIVRGNTYRLQTIPANAQPDPIELQKQQESQRRNAARNRVKEKLRPQTPEAVDGRKHIDVQTELYLEELSDRVPEADAEAQTDAFLDRPPSPLFVPPKTGIDVATQILNGELFDFDLEVKPILEVIVGKTLEQSMMEVMEEEELDTLRDHQIEYEELRKAELIETQRMEEQARRRQDEKLRRIKQQQAVAQAEKETAEKIAARAFSRNYLSQLLPSVFGHLRDNGFFFDVQEREIESQFLPWLLDATETRITKAELARKILDALLQDLISKRSIKPEEPAVPAVVVAEPVIVPEPVVTVTFAEPEASTQEPAPGEDGDVEQGGNDDGANDQVESPQAEAEDDVDGMSTTANNEEAASEEQ